MFYALFVVKLELYITIHEHFVRAVDLSEMLPLLIGTSLSGRSKELRRWLVRGKEKQETVKEQVLTLLLLVSVLVVASFLTHLNYSYIDFNKTKENLTICSHISKKSKQLNLESSKICNCPVLHSKKHVLV